MGVRFFQWKLCPEDELWASMVSVTTFKMMSGGRTADDADATDYAGSSCSH